MVLICMRGVFIILIVIGQYRDGAGLPPPAFATFDFFMRKIRLVSDFHDVMDSDNRTSRDVSNTLEYDARSLCSPGDSQPLNRVDTKSRLKSLRHKMKENSFVALIIPSSDEHQNEYVAPSDQRREFITGFSGSAGTAVVTEDDHVVWTDARYTLQADQETDCSWKLITQTLTSLSPTQWLKDHLPNGSKVGADMRLYGAGDWEEAQKKLSESNITFEDSNNIVDEVWDSFGRPPRNNGSLFVHDLQYAGIRWQNKIRSIREDMKPLEADLLVVTALDEVAWLLNLRGSDIPYNPVFRSYLILEAKEEGAIHLFLLDHSQLPEAVKSHLHLDSCSEAGTCIEMHPYNSVKTFLERIAERDDVKKVLLSKHSPYSVGVSYYIYSAVPEEKRVLHPSPIMLRKAQKVGAEGRSMKEAQVKDSVALVEFFAFLEKEIKDGAKWDEISVLTPLRKFRGEQSHFRGDSFEAISAFGSNAALTHYVPSNQTKKVITDQSLYLLDSGGQYLDGTTDVTRTMHFGTPTLFQKEAYTRVLQGVIDLATLVFPAGTKDSLIDIVARRPLLDGGLNYGHGTGHGIGLYLGIHEGPTLVAMSDSRSSTIEVGQFFSDEPGYYKKGSFGIRLESIIRVLDHPTFKDARGHSLLHFEMVTLVPFEPKLIDHTMLTYKQLSFLNNYNDKIEQIIGKRLLNKGNKEAYDWMVARTRRLNYYRATTARAPYHQTESTWLLAMVTLEIFAFKVLL